MIVKAMISILLVLCTPVHAVVVGQTYEGYSLYNDVYIVSTGAETYEIEADDLEIGDEITVYFLGNEPVRTLYGWR